MSVWSVRDAAFVSTSRTCGRVSWMMVDMCGIVLCLLKYMSESDVFDVVVYIFLRILSNMKSVLMLKDARDDVSVDKSYAADIRSVWVLMCMIVVLMFIFYVVLLWFWMKMLKLGVVLLKVFFSVFMYWCYFRFLIDEVLLMSKRLKVTTLYVVSCLCECDVRLYNSLSKFGIILVLMIGLWNCIVKLMMSLR